MTPKDVMSRITMTPELKNFIIKLNARCLGHLRQNLCNLVGIMPQDETMLYTLTNVPITDIKASAEDLPGGYILRTPLYNLLMYISVKAEQMGDLNTAYDCATLFSLITLGRLKYKYIRVCNAVNMTNTISGMSKKTYVGTNGLVWMVYKVAQSTYDKYREVLVKDPNDLHARLRYIIDIRNKFNQIMKHIARLYYATHLNQSSTAKNDTAIKSISTSILSMIITNDIPSTVVNYIATLAKVQHDDVYQMHHFVQINASAQQYVDVLITFIVKRLVELQSIGADQGVIVNEINPDLVRKMYGSFRRTALGKVSAQDNIFASQNIPESLVLAFVVVLVCFYWQQAQKYEIDIIDQSQHLDNISLNQEE